jgi:hypothetical protein
VRKLATAVTKQVKDDNMATITRLKSFIEEVKAQQGKSVTTDQAEHLINAAKNIIILYEQKLI